MNHPQTIISTIRNANDGRSQMPNLHHTLDTAFDWLIENVRPYSYLLPDTLELALYLCLIAYFAIQLGQQTA